MKRLSVYPTVLAHSYRLLTVVVGSLLVSVLMITDAQAISEQIFSLAGEHLKAYERCFKKDSDTLSADARKTFCSAKHEQLIDGFLSEGERIDLEATGGYKNDRKEFNVTINNTTDNYVITRLEIWIKHYDKKSVITLCDARHYYGPLWAEPGDRRAKATCSDLDYIPMESRTSAHHFEWGISSVYGFEIR